MLASMFARKKGKEIFKTTQMKHFSRTIPLFMTVSKQLHNTNRDDTTQSYGWNLWASTNLCQEAYCVEHTDQALLRNHLLLSTVVGMLTIYSLISLMFPTSYCVVLLKYMVSSKKIPVCKSRDNYVWHQISGKTIARSSHSNKLRCKTISLLVSSQF